MIIQTTLNQTDFVGLFSFFKGETLVVQKGLTQKELLKLKDLKLQESEIDLPGLFTVANSNGSFSIDPPQKAIGNLVVANDKGAIVSPLIENLKKDIEEALKVKATVGTIAGLNIVGSVVLANNNAAAIHPEASEEDRELVKKVLGVEVQTATLMKSGFLGSLAVVNDNTLIVAGSALPTEVYNLMELFDIE